MRWHRDRKRRGRLEDGRGDLYFGRFIYIAARGALANRRLIARTHDIPKVCDEQAATEAVQNGPFYACWAPVLCPFRRISINHRERRFGLRAENVGLSRSSGG
jgi:hypothetical protein